MLFLRWVSLSPGWPQTWILCLHLLSAGVIDMCNCSWFMTCWGWNLEPWACWASTLLMVAHLQALPSPCACDGVSASPVLQPPGCLALASATLPSKMLTAGNVVFILLANPLPIPFRISLHWAHYLVLHRHRPTEHGHCSLSILNTVSLVLVSTAHRHFSCLHLGLPVPDRILLAKQFPDKSLHSACDRVFTKGAKLTVIFAELCCARLTFPLLESSSLAGGILKISAKPPTNF